MWRVKKLNMSLLPSSPPVSAGESRTGASRAGARGIHWESCLELGGAGVRRLVGPATPALAYQAGPPCCGTHRRLREEWKADRRSFFFFFTRSHLSFSGQTSHEDSSSRTYAAAQCPHQLRKRGPHRCLAVPIPVQDWTAGEIRLAHFSAGLFAEPESPEEQRARAGT